MTREQNCNENPDARGISRREFIKLAAAAGLLAGCRPTRQLTVTSTSPPTATATLPPTRTAGPTAEPTATQPADPTATSTLAPTAPPTITPSAELSKVVYAHHAGVWDGDTLAPEAIRQMLDASITELTGLNDAGEAWASLFDPGERIAIKVNTIQQSSFWTHIPLVMAVTERLQEIGVPAEQIVIFDRSTSELERAGYPINEDGAGVRCYGSGFNYTTGWTIMDTEIGLSEILLDCDALINMPILKQHGSSGVTFAMKNHYGNFDRPEWFHRPAIERALAELNNLSPIRDHTRLIIGDALTVCPRNWNKAVTWSSILASFDPVAHDTIGLQILGEVMASEELDPTAATNLANTWLANGAELGLGTNDLDAIELVEVTL
jgi:uncharacterized protein (DUF362 family)